MPRVFRGAWRQAVRAEVEKSQPDSVLAKLLIVPLGYIVAIFALGGNAMLPWGVRAAGFQPVLPRLWEGWYA